MNDYLVPADDYWQWQEREATEEVREVRRQETARVCPPEDETVRTVLSLRESEAKIMNTTTTPKWDESEIHKGPGGAAGGSMNEKPHISATQLEMFWRCPEQYRRRYIEGERLPPAIAQITGTAYHKGAEANFRQKIESHADLPGNQIVEAAVAGFEAELAGGYALTDEEASTGAAQVLEQAKDVTARVAGAFATQQAPDYQPVVVEHTTRIIFPSASHDLLAVTDLRDDQARVVDLKTAARRMPTNAADVSTQLTVYAAAYKIECGHDPAEVRLDIVTKAKESKRQVLATNRTAADFRAFVARVNVTLAAIRSGNFPPCPPGSWVCSPKWCGFFRSCPYVNSERIALADNDKGE